MKNLFQRNKRDLNNLTLRILALESAIDCLFNSPTYVDSDDFGFGRFNGQSFRRRIFTELLKTVVFEAIIETGTYTGNTTGYMAKTSCLPVYTCELNNIYLSIARKRLEGMSNINFMLSDSRRFLHELAKKEVCKRKSFIYLDAHGYEDVPLKEEIEIICNNWKDFVIMVDDFQVPGDSGYGYDNYGKNKTLSLNNYTQVITKHDLVPFFPTLPSAEETGYKRGCIILAKRGETSNGISRLNELAQHVL